MQFGRSSEKLEREIEQLELAPRGARDPSPDRDQPDRRRRRPSARRARVRCPSTCRASGWCTSRPAAARECGADMRTIGEDVSEVLDYVPGRFRVIRHVRPKLACAECDASCRCRRPSRPIERGLRRGGAARPRPGVQVRRSPAAVSPERRSTPAKGWSWSARRWPSGWASASRCSSRWSRRSARYVVATPEAARRRHARCRCSTRDAARPRPGGCGPMCAMIGRPAARTRRRCCSATRRIEAASGRGNT